MQGSYCVKYESLIYKENEEWSINYHGYSTRQFVTTYLIKYGNLYYEC